MCVCVYAGARKCPGSRIANLEVHAIILQLVKDWHFRLECLALGDYLDDDGKV